MMVVIPAGKFVMGSPANELGRNDNEGPQHEVTVTQPFAASKFEVTFDEWDACVAFGDCAQVSDSSWGHRTRPVINVTWYDAQQYVAWLSKMTGKAYRLLTEAEWEYAARAGTTTAYFWGDDVEKGMPTVPAAAANGTVNRLRRPARSPPILSACTTCMAMYGSG